MESIAPYITHSLKKIYTFLIYEKCDLKTKKYSLVILYFIVETILEEDNCLGNVKSNIILKCYGLCRNVERYHLQRQSST